MDSGEHYRGDKSRRLGMRTWIKAQYKAIRTRYWKWRVNRSIRVLDELDWNLKRAGYNRTDRRRFWREFTKKQEIRTEVFNRMTQE